MRTAIALAFLLVANTCYGHGNPIHVDVNNGRLTVSDGLSLSFGFVEQAFDDHEDSYLEDLGEIALSITPGFNVNGMTPGSQLRLEVVPRPDFSVAATSERWLWFWSKTSEQVEVATNNPKLELASQQLLGDVLLTQFAPPTTGSSMLFMEPQSSELGTHQHPIAYVLDNDPQAEFGAYGFFARLTSPNYQPSEPFLVALNHSLSHEEYVQAAREINAAASLPGDFDEDHRVDGADFLAWQRSFGSTTNLAADASLNGTVDAADLAIWKQNFGRSWPASAAIATPEPTTFALIAWSLLALNLRTSRALPTIKTGCRE
jgi:hypothetical protein